MRKPDGTIEQMPAWLLARYVAVAAELERTHGAKFAAAFLVDLGIAPNTLTSEDQQPSVEEKEPLAHRCSDKAESM
jgi:hypothetical protein